jgi:hypothetical protein
MNIFSLSKFSPRTLAHALTKTMPRPVPRSSHDTHREKQHPKDALKVHKDKPKHHDNLKSNADRGKHDDKDSRSSVHALGHRLTHSTAKIHPPKHVDPAQRHEHQPPAVQHKPPKKPDVVKKGRYEPEKPVEKLEPVPNPKMEGKAALRDKENASKDPAEGPNRVRAKASTNKLPKANAMDAACKTFLTHPDMFSHSVREALAKRCQTNLVAQSDAPVASHGPTPAAKPDDVDTPQPGSGWDPDTSSKHPGKGADQPKPNVSASASGSVFREAVAPLRLDAAAKALSARQADDTLTPRFLPPAFYGLGAVVSGAGFVYSLAEDKDPSYIIASLAALSACTYNLYILDTFNNGQ